MDQELVEHTATSKQITSHALDGLAGAISGCYCMQQRVSGGRCAAIFDLLSHTVAYRRGVRTPPIGVAIFC